MRTRITILLAGLALLLGLGYLTDWSDIFPRDKRYLLVPGPVTGSREAGVNASFRLVAESAIDPGEQGQRPIVIYKGIETNYEGGACLVLSADDLGLATSATPDCTTDAECKLTGVEFGYCAPAPRRCWVKPQSIAAKLCRKSRPEGLKWDPEIDNRLPKEGTVDVGPAQLLAGRATRIRLITCLETTVGTPQTGCPSRGSEMVEKWGPIKEL